MSTDRKELNDAIDSVNRAIDGCPNYWDRENTMKVLRTLRAATRAHMETLPKPMWRVTGCLRDGSPVTPAHLEEQTNALDTARSWLRCGRIGVSVVQVQS